MKNKTNFALLFIFSKQIILKTSSSPATNATSSALPQGQILQTADGQLIILQSAEQAQPQQTQYVQVGGQSKNNKKKIFSFFD